MSGGRGRRLVEVFAGLVVVLVVAAGVGAVLADSPVTFVPLARVTMFTAVGVVIARQHPRHPVAWVLLVSALLSAVNQGADPWARWGLTHGWNPSVVHALAVAFTLPWVGAVFLPFTVGLLRFPDGRLPGRLWAGVEAVALTAVVGFTGCLGVLSATTSTTDLLADDTATFTGWRLSLFHVCEAAIVVLVGCLLLTVVSVVVRWRRSGAVAREQIRWVLAAGVVAIVVQVVVVVVDLPGWAQEIGTGVGYALLAVAVGFAVTRSKLYDIDRIVRRTVAYTAVLVLLAAVYVGIVTGAAVAVPEDYGQVGTALATLAVTVLFLPLTRRTRRVVDRRFDRARVDAEAVVAQFAAQVRARPDADDLPGDLLQVVDRAVHPTHAGLWVVRR